MDWLSLPFTRHVNQSFGSEPSQVPFYALFAFFAVDRKRRFWVQQPAKWSSVAVPFDDQ